MKSKDQVLLEEAYLKVSEGKYMDNYGRFRGKPKGSPLSDFDDSANRELQNDERNAGLEDDYESETETSSAPQAVASTTPAPAPVAVDPSAWSGKKIGSTLFDPGEYVVTLDGKPTGGTFDKKEIEQLVQSLNSGEHDNPLVQRWVMGAKNLGDL